MSHACVGMLEARRKLLLMPTQAWDMAPENILCNQSSTV